MRGLLIVLTIAATCISTLIGCYPNTSDNPPPSIPVDIRVWTSRQDDSIDRSCDSLGVCCYHWTGAVSCVATQVEIIVRHGDIEDETQRSPAYGGEVSGRALEKRLPARAFGPPN